MSTIAWDGKTLAVDRQATRGNIRGIASKAFVHGDMVLSGVGGASEVRTLVAWYLAGANPEDWPEVPDDGEFAPNLLVLKGGKLVEYIGLPVPLEVEEPFTAWGTGGNVAIGAMAMGADAKKAIEIASQHDIYTGMGVVCFG